MAVIASKRKADDITQDITEPQKQEQEQEQEQEHKTHAHQAGGESLASNGAQPSRPVSAPEKKEPILPTDKPHAVTTEDTNHGMEFTAVSKLTAQVPTAPKDGHADTIWCAPINSPCFTPINTPVTKVGTHLPGAPQEGRADNTGGFTQEDVAAVGYTPLKRPRKRSRKPLPTVPDEKTELSVAHDEYTLLEAKRRPVKKARKQLPSAAAEDPDDHACFTPINEGTK